MAIDHEEPSFNKVWWHSAFENKQILTNIQHKEPYQSIADERVIKLESRIEQLEKALQALVIKNGKTEDEKDEKTDKPDNAPKAATIHMSEEEKYLPSNWAVRFQWRRRNLSREGEEYIVIPSPGQEADDANKSFVPLVQDEDVKGAPERILIRNQRIQNKFRDLPGIETYEELRLNLNSIEISSPFSPLFHYIEIIAEQIKEDKAASVDDTADSMWHPFF